ncbi:unnamed protein product [Symbiodinium sp. CCMP2592]|nr:unnamed protein product [Symbiodinium sp. CCMP2592]
MLQLLRLRVLQAESGAFHRSYEEHSDLRHRLGAASNLQLRPFCGNYKPVDKLTVLSAEAAFYKCQTPSLNRTTGPAQTVTQLLGCSGCPGTASAGQQGG